jgi:hypothetical protein
MFAEWQSTGSGFTPNAYVNASIDNSWQVAATADLDGDGRADILWRNSNSGLFTEWQSTGNGFTPNVHVNGTVNTRLRPQGMSTTTGLQTFFGVTTAGYSPNGNQPAMASRPTSM